MARVWYAKETSSKQKYTNRETQTEFSRGTEKTKKKIMRETKTKQTNLL